jgi:hypothetical protein
MTSRRPIAWSPTSLAPVLFAALAACSSGAGGQNADAHGNGGDPFFPMNFRESGFQKVRACRAPGEHSGINGFTVWVDDGAAATYDQILSGGAGDGGTAQMPPGAVVIKELYGDRDCTVVDRWVAMQKIGAFDPAHGDWFWQDLSATRAVLRQGQLPACSDCHEGRADGTCVGFGASNGMDYLCTAP